GRRSPGRSSSCRRRPTACRARCRARDRQSLRRRSIHRSGTSRYWVRSRCSEFAHYNQIILARARKRNAEGKHLCPGPHKRPFSGSLHALRQLFGRVRHDLPMSPTPNPADPEVDQPQDEQESPPPACVLSFNASDASGAGGIAGDIATIAAMGAHCLPVVTAIVLRDTAEVFEHESLDPDPIAEQARPILEDVPITAWKVGFLGNAEGVSAVAEVLSDYPDVPLVTYLPSVAWIDEDDQQQYLDALRELV